MGTDRFPTDGRAGNDRGVTELSDVNEALKVQRHLIAQASGGFSGEPVYAAFEKALVAFGLQGDLLDFGAGKGNLIKRFQQLGRFRKITGVDLMERPEGLEESIEWITADLNDPLHIADKSFDVIMSCEVISCLENPRALAREWFRLLCPGGTLVFSTLNNESWRSLLSLLVRGHFVSFSERCYPIHITALLRKDIERILKEAGFSMPVFIFTDSGSIPKFTKIHWQVLGKRLFRGLRYSDNLLAVTHKPH